jgi:hypothetical protein
MTTFLYIKAREFDSMDHNLIRTWGMAVAGVGALAIFGVLPQWATIAAVLTLPALLAPARCGLRSREG